MLNSLFATSYIPELGASHRTAACNVLCAAIEYCSIPSDALIQQVIDVKVSGRLLFRIYLDRYDGAKPKCMRQVLITLIKLLALDLNRSTTAPLFDEVIEEFWKILFIRKDNVKAKPAFFALTFFITKNLITTSNLLATYERFINVEGSETPLRDALDRFFISAFDWVLFSNVAPVLGQFVAVFFKKAQNQHASYDSTVMPTWYKALVVSANRHINHVHSFKTYLFPALFGLNTLHYLRFLQYLRIEKHLSTTISLLQGGTETLKDNQDVVANSQDSTMLFSVLQVGKEMGLVCEYGK